MPERTRRRREIKLRLLLLAGFCLIIIAVLGWQHAVLVYD